MTKAGFESMVDTSISYQDYRVIDLVYMWHPSVEDKVDIANIYLHYGMMVIEDMRPRARRIFILDRVFGIRKKS